MSTHSVEIVQIAEILPHSNADRLAITKINGWQCVIGKDSFKVGDKAIYVEPDYEVPLDNPLFAFLKSESHPNRTYSRIKVRRLRKEFSQGLLVPVPDELDHLPVGTNVMQELKIRRYEPTEPFFSNPKLRSKQSSGPSGISCPKYDLESLQKYNKVFEDNQFVIATEKLHGCLRFDTLISMADGSFKRINQVAVGDYVLGADKEGKLIPSKVLNTFNNGKTTQWLKVKGSRRKAGRGPAEFAVYATSNHKFFTESGYVEAQSLQKGNKVYLIRNELEITPIQEQVAIGKLLGDGSLRILDSGSAAIVWCHSEKDECYLDWTARAFGELCKGTRSLMHGGYSKTPRIKDSTIFSYLLKREFECFIANGRKTVPREIIGKFGPISLAFLYMDDGSLSHNVDQEDRASLATCSFTIEENNILLEAIARLGIIGTQYFDGKYNRIRFDIRNSEKLFLTVAPYVPPCMQRKLPERYRGFNGFLPIVENTYKPLIVEQEISSIEKVKPASQGKDADRFDLETETHNYFANNVLVHNCNSRFVYAKTKFGKWKLFCGSRTRWIKEVTPTYFTKFLSKIIGLVSRSWQVKFNRRNNIDGYLQESVWTDMPKINKAIETWCRANPEKILYGEIFGNVQDLRYGAIESQYYFAAFDILDHGKWLNYDEFCTSVDSVPGLNRVPEIYRGPFNLEMLKTLSDSLDSKWPGANHLAEGIVVRPPQEQIHPRCGRMVLKLVSNRYLERD